MKALTISECRSCQSKKLKDIISLGNFYLSDFSSDNTKPKKYPLDLIICENCKLVQLRHNAPQALLYTENYGYRSGINQTMQHELQEIATDALKLLNSKKKNITAVDIGANDGTLLSFYPSHIERIGVEPIKKLAKECKKNADTVINDFFNYESFNKKIPDKRADIITIISCFYDMEQPNKFIEDVNKILNEDGIVVIQQNYLVSMLSLNAFDNIVHEHLEYYSLHSLSYLLEKHDLEVIHVSQNTLNGGSFRTYIARKGRKKISQTVKDLFDHETNLGLTKKKIYSDFAKRIEKNKRMLWTFISEQVKKGKKVYVYGASTRGNTLLQYYGLNKKHITFAVERNKEKWGKKIASTGIPIISEDQARKDMPEYMLVLPWFFKEEFLTREKGYLEKGGHFIFPLPEMEII